MNACSMPATQGLLLSRRTPLVNLGMTTGATACTCAAPMSGLQTVAPISNTRQSGVINGLGNINAWWGTWDRCFDTTVARLTLQPILVSRLKCVPYGINESLRSQNEDTLTSWCQ